MTPATFGREAYRDGKHRTENPYRRTGPSRAAWFAAYDAAKIADRLEP
jgi:hypothetical protein